MKVQSGNFQRHQSRPAFPARLRCNVAILLRWSSCHLFLLESGIGNGSDGRSRSCGGTKSVPSMESPSWRNRKDHEVNTKAVQRAPKTEKPKPNLAKNKSQEKSHS